jgi:lysyl-tRNA synthetase class 2
MLVNKFIEAEIEPSSKNKIVIFKDYPICTISSARKIQNTKSLINRFELFINGSEIMHAYEDENDLEDFINRSKKVDLYNYEEKIIINNIKDGILPSNSAGLGIGIERLCMAVYNVNNINEYFFSSNF